MHIKTLSSIFGLCRELTRKLERNGDYSDMIDILVSVLMSTYNEPIDFISAALNSIERQTYKNIEIVVVNDNPLREDLTDFLDDLKRKGKIVLVNNEHNIGLTKSLNRGLQYCNGAIIARMDADDISDENRIENELKYMFYYNLDIVGTYIQPINMNGKPCGHLKKYPVWNTGCKCYLKSRSSLIHPTWIVKKEVFNELEGYRDYNCAEDYDFLLRASKKFRMACCPVVGLRYRINNSGISQSNKLKQKVVSRYLRDNIKSIDNVEPEDINIDMELRSQKTAEIAEYFSQIDEIRNMRNNDNFMFLEKYIELLLKSGYARSAFGEIVRIKFVMIVSTLIEKRGKKRWQYI